MFQKVVIVPLASISPPWTRCLPASTLRDGSFGSGSRALSFSVRKSAARTRACLRADPTSCRPRTSVLLPGRGSRSRRRAKAPRPTGSTRSRRRSRSCRWTGACRRSRPASSASRRRGRAPRGGPTRLLVVRVEAVPAEAGRDLEFADRDRVQQRTPRTCWTVVSTCEETWRCRRTGRADSGAAGSSSGTPVYGAADRVGGLAAELDARDERVAERSGVELERRVELVLEEGLGALGGDLVARHLDLVERRLRRRRARQPRLGDAAVAGVAGVARLVPDRDVRRELVREADRAHVGARVEEGSVLEAVVVGAVDRRGLVEVPGDAVVGNVPGRQVEVRQRQLGRAVEAESDRRRDAPPRFCVTSRPATWFWLPMAESWNAAPSPKAGIGWSMSAVTR